MRGRPPHLCGRVDRPKLEQLLGSDLASASVDEWFAEVRVDYDA